MLLPTATQTRAGIPEGSTSLLSLPLKLTTQVTFTLAKPKRCRFSPPSQVYGISGQALYPDQKYPTQEGGGLADERLWKELNFRDFVVVHQVHFSVELTLEGLRNSH
ncbi:hypothetical protein QQF64_025362 [Cirrhinus molitorella]|uniref:Uncharacterized protein n=2 Tax=Cirrhinus molitorella TaxID=172907 RepID=A0ABR3NP50_9TELE|nr:hypothetical protein Q8A67_001142 [Cirrhinus molitorella]